jgi:glycerophosphoryl diester phosphodiesterase
MKLLGFSLGLVLLFSAVVHFVRRQVALPSRPKEFEIIAHRGVHQTFPLNNLENDTCTAALIGPPEHHFLENTIPSIAEAFKDSATMVELDIQPTSDHHMVVFHDWGLDCRTDGHGITHDQPVAELKKLDIAYGYTADNGKTFPLRGDGIGMMPTLEEVFATFPDRKLLVQQKDRDIRTAELFGAIVGTLSAEQQRQIYWFGPPEMLAELRRRIPHITNLFPSAGQMRQCGKSLFMRLGFGDLPPSCRLNSLLLPARYLWMVPGWPNDFLQKAAKAGVTVYVMDVDTTAEAEELTELPIHGIMTNKIEIIGPFLRQIRSR